MTNWPTIPAALALAAAGLTPLLAGCDSGPVDPLAAAKIAYADAKPRTAMDLLSDAISADPADIEARMLAAEVAMALGNPDRAVSELERVIETGEAPKDAKARLLEAYVVGNYSIKARETFAELTYDHPEAFSAALGLELAEGNFAAGFAKLDEGLAQFPNDQRLITSDAERLVMLSQPAEAAQRLAPVLEQQPIVPEAHILAGRMQLAEGELDAAKAHFETALTMRPAHQATMLAMAAIARDQGDEANAARWINKANEVGQPHPVGLLFAAQMAYDAGDIDRANELIEKAPPAFMDQSQFLRLRGFVDAARGAHALAVPTLQDYVAATGGDQTARRVLAESLVAQEQFAAAWDVIEPLVGHPQTDGGTLLLALNLAVETGQGDAQQIQGLIRKRASAPDIAPAMRDASSAIKSGDWAKADAIYTPLVAGVGAEDPVLLNNAAAVKSKLDQHSEAVALARRALAAAPDTPEILDTLGWALWQQGRSKSEARALLTRARDAAPQNREIAEHWAIAHAGA